jgi:copper chaperone CopZ
METLTLDVDGMSCGGCVLSVERALEGAPGVVRVRVSLEERRAEGVGNGLEAARLIAAVDEAGFDARARA